MPECEWQKMYSILSRYRCLKQKKIMGGSIKNAQWAFWTTYKLASLSYWCYIYECSLSKNSTIHKIGYRLVGGLSLPFFSTLVHISIHHPAKWRQQCTFILESVWNGNKKGLGFPMSRLQHNHLFFCQYICKKTV